MFDPDTGTYISPRRRRRCTQAPVWSGRSPRPPASSSTAARGVSLRTYTVTLPHAAPVPQVGDTVTVTGSADPAVTGEAMWVLDVPGDEFAVTRRIVGEARQ